MGKVKKQTGKSSTKRSKVIKHLRRTYLPRAAEDPNRKHKVAEKVIDHKNEGLHIWYLIRFKDMAKPQWLPENNISGCKQLIQEYWIRENAVNKVDTNVGTSQDEYQNLDESKYNKSLLSNNSRVQLSHVESHDRSSPFSHNESFSQPSGSKSYANNTRSQFCYKSDVGSRNFATSTKIQKSQKSQGKVSKNPITNKSTTRYEENRRVSFAENPKAVNKPPEIQKNLESINNITTSKAPKVMNPILTKGKNKIMGSDTEDFVAQPHQLEGVQSQRLDSQKLTLDEFITKIKSEMKLPQKSTTSCSIHSANNELGRIPSNTPIGGNIKWSGNIIKGSLVLFVASVDITPFPGRCDNLATLEKIVNEKVPKLCIQHSLPLSYALNLIKDKNSSKYSVFEIRPSQIIKSKHNISMEKTIMMRSKIVGVIWIEEYKTAWIIFPYYERICSILKLPDKKELKLFAVSISMPSIFDPLPLNSEAEGRLILPNADRFSVEEMIKTKVFLQQTGYFSELLDICKDQIHFTYFGNEEFPDVQELLLAMKILGAIYEDNYNENISIVFVHIIFLKQLLFMRNFMNFKRLLNCKFLIFGTDLRESPEPIRFKEYLPKGGMVSVTTYTFLQEEQVSSRIMNIIDHQLATRNAPWDYLLYVNVTDNLADIGQNQNNRHALRAWHEAMAAIGAKKARYIKKEEIFMHNRIFEEPPPMISSLYRTMLRIHAMYAAERRDFILIRHTEEEELANEPVPGVWKMSLREFEQIFGPTE